MTILKTFNIDWITVNAVFENVAQDYDLMNDVMSLAIHRIWKDYFLMKLSTTNSTKLLDVAGGTGNNSLYVLTM